MNAPITIDQFDSKFAALNRANDDVAKAQRAIKLLQDFQRHRLEGVTSKASRFWEEVTRYQLAGALSDLLGVDGFEEAMDAAAEELWREHSYDIVEEVNLDANGDPANSFRFSPIGGKL